MWSKAISWIDDCRIPFVEDINFDYRTTRVKQQTIYGDGKGIPKLNGNPEYDNRGRFPANILVSDDMLNDGNSGGSSYCAPTKYGYEKSSEKFNNGAIRTKTGIGDKGTNSRYYDIDKWFEKILNYE